MPQKIMLRIIFALLLVCSQLFSFSQDSSRLRVSLLTCTPGDELYSTFGHSAVRVIDSSDRRVYSDGLARYNDVVYNYGTFNFDDPNFYAKFVKGQLLYYLDTTYFDNFEAEYRFYNRGITEQVLDLSGIEKIAIHSALRENAKEENKYYKYDFFLDNCTTRLRDLIAKNKQPAPVLPPVMPVDFRFRQAIHQYLDQNKKYWSKLGIDLLLGAPCDQVMTTAQQEFLPDNLMIAFDSTKNTRMVLSSTNLYQLAPVAPDSSWFTPMVFFSLLLILYILLSFSSKKIFRTTLYILDGLLFFFTGLLGFLLLFMWFGTDHSMTKVNYNLLWAWPVHAIAAFFISTRKAWIRKYFLITAIGMILVLISWFFLPQQLNTALLPLTALLLFRAFARSRQ